MSLDISKHGDILEVRYNDIILEKLPAYKQIWERYIGNNGDAKMLGLSNLSKAEERRRHIFAQFHYSCFESVVSLRFIRDKMDSFKVHSIEDYIQANNDFLAFQAHAGRIRDGVARLGELCKLGNIEAELNEYYQQRNEILHGCKIPFMLIEGAIAIPRPKGAEEDESAWHSEKAWSEVNEKDFDFLSQYLSATYDGLTNILNKSLYKVLGFVVSLTKTQHLTLTTPDDLDKRFSPTVSGLFDNHVFINSPQMLSGSVAINKVAPTAHNKPYSP